MWPVGETHFGNHCRRTVKITELPAPGCVSQTMMNERRYEECTLYHLFMESSVLGETKLDLFKVKVVPVLSKTRLLPWTSGQWSPQGRARVHRKEETHAESSGPQATVVLDLGSNYTDVFFSNYLINCTLALCRSVYIIFHGAKFFKKERTWAERISEEED